MDVVGGNERDADARGQLEADRALRRARPFLRRHLARRLRLRHVPELTFFHDDAVEQEDRVARLLDEIAASRTDDASTDDSGSS